MTPQLLTLQRQRQLNSLSNPIGKGCPALCLPPGQADSESAGAVPRGTARAARLGEYDRSPTGPVQTSTRVLKAPHGQTASV